MKEGDGRHSLESSENTDLRAVQDISVTPISTLTLLRLFVDAGLVCNRSLRRLPLKIVMKFYQDATSEQFGVRNRRLYF